MKPGAKQHLFLSLLLVAAALLSGTCATAGRTTVSAAPEAGTNGGEEIHQRLAETLAAARNPCWQECAPGIWTADLPQSACGTEFAAVKIRLDRVTLCASLPSAGETGQPVFSGEFPADFARRTGAAVAVNMTPFAKTGDGLVPVGIYINRGRQYSPPNARYGAVLFFPGGKAEIIPSQDEAASARIRQAEFAFGGFWTVLENGEIRGFPERRNSRTMLGLSRDGGTLFLLAAGRPGLLPGGGITFTEGGRLMQALGAEHALQMDGGSSTSLFAGGTQRIPSGAFFFRKKNRKTAVNAGFLPRPVLP